MVLQLIVFSVVSLLLFLGLFFYLFAPSFFAIPLTLKKFEKKHAVPVMLFFLLFIGTVFVNKVFFIGYGFFVIGTVFLIVIFLREHITQQKFLILSALFPLVLISLMWILHYDLSGKLVMSIQNSYALFMKNMQSNHWSTMTENNVQIAVEQSIYIVQHFLVSILYIILFYVLIINVSVAEFWVQQYSIKNKMKKKRRNIPMKLPDILLWLLIAVWSFVAFCLSFKQNHLVIVGLNIAFMVSSFYVLQGWAVLLNFYRKIRLSNFVKIFLIILLIEFLPFVTILLFVFAFGLFDEWFNFRKLKFTGGH